MTKTSGLTTQARRFLLPPLWIGLLAWPLMGGTNAGQLALTLAVSGVTGWVLYRFCVSEGFQNVVARLSFSASRPQGFEPLRIKQALFLGAGLLIIVLPLFLNNYYVDILNLAALYALLAMGLNITVGYTGLLDLGYAAFYGVGAYAYALLSTGIGLSFWLGIPFGGAVAACFGLILGLITLRLRGDYLAIVTLGFVQIIYLCLNNWDAVTQGPNGIMQIGRPALGAFVFRQPLHFYYLILVFLGLTAIAIHRLLQSQIGRAWIAIREDEIAAEAMGIDTTRMKMLAFVLGAGIAGVAGVFFAARYTFISPESFTFLESVRILSMVVLGGMGSLSGAVLGAFLLTVLPELLRGLANYRMLIFGMALVLMMIFRPQGLLGKKQ
ncbi:MAG: branched-chain amino acid ABC transporter permease [Nitrospiria bacterium]